MVANAFSRIEVLVLSSTNTLAIDVNTLAAAQREDMELHRLHLQSVTGSLTFREVPPPGTNTNFVCVIHRQDSHAPFVPAAFRCTVFDTLHSLTHPGI